MRSFGQSFVGGRSTNAPESRANPGRQPGRLLQFTPAMPEPETQRASDAPDRLVALEERLARIETYLGIEKNRDSVARGLPLASISTAPIGDELEFEVGQNWFAFAGVV